MTATLVQEPDSIESMLQLNFEVDPEGHAAAYLPVRWCLNRDKLLPRLQKRGFTNPYLVLCVRHVQSRTVYGNSVNDYTVTSLYVVPLEQELQYIAFNRPGTNEVVAAIVDMQGPHMAKRLRKLTRDPWLADQLFNEFGAPIKRNFRYGKEGNYDGYYAMSVIGTGCVQRIDVDAEHFAKPRAAWRNSVVRAFYPNIERDECHFRKREWFVCWPALLVLTVPVTILKLALLALGMFFGAYGLDYKSVLNPLKWKPYAPVARPTGSYWFVKNPSKEASRDENGVLETRSPFFWLFNPIVMLLPALVTFGIFQIHAHGHKLNTMGWWRTLLYVDVAIVLLVIAAALVGFVGTGVVMLFDKLFASQKRADKRALRRIAEAERLREEAQKRLLDMSCSLNGATASVNALPRDKQTIKLRFAALKGQVCKPFAQ